MRSPVANKILSETPQEIKDKVNKIYMTEEIEEPYYDKNGVQIKEFAVLKVFHFIGARRKKHYMYKWVRLLKGTDGKMYWTGRHLTEDDTGYYRLSCQNNGNHKLNDAEIVQQY